MKTKNFFISAAIAILLISGTFLGSAAAQQAPANVEVAATNVAKAINTNATAATNPASAAAILGQKIKETANTTTAIQDKIITYLIENGPKLFGAFIIIFIGILVARSFGKLLMKWLTKKEMEPPVRMLITRIAKLLVTGFALVIALGTMGFNIMALVTGIGVAGVGVSLATQGVLSNLVAGLVIIFTKPFKVGEYVEMIGVEGQVSSIELFSTTLQHWDRSRVVIPNRRIVGEVLHNYGTIRQLDLSVGVTYDTDLARAISTLRNVLKNDSRVLKDLPPVIGVTGLADSAINICVKPWVRINDWIPSQAELYQAIVDQFRKEGIEMPFPQREIRILNGAEVPPLAKLAQ
jgi:small conductance mechanosensitive channel